MSYHLQYLRTPLNSRSSYNLMKDVLIVDGRSEGRQYRWKDEMLLRARRQSEYLRGYEYVDPVVRSLKRDQLQFISKHRHTLNSSLITNSNSTYSKDPIPQSKSYLSTQLSQSTLAHPYTYTQYSIMKQTEQKKRKIEEEWLQNEIKRIRQQNNKINNSGQQNQIQYYCESKGQGCVDVHAASKRSSCPKSKSALYNRLLVFNNPTQQPTTQLRPQSSSQLPLLFSTNHHNYEHKSQHIQQHQQSTEPNHQYQMNIRSSQPSYPIFSPLKVHKHLPHNTNQHMSYNIDQNQKKQTKHFRALEEGKENEYYYPIYEKEDVEKKGVLTKSYDHQTFVERKAFYEHKRNEDLPSSVGVRNPEVFIGGVGHQSKLLPTIHPHYPHHPHHHQTTPQSLANGLKVELQILKQQLDDKNKRVVDLQIELLQLKCSIFDKTTNEKKEAGTQMEQKNETINDDIELDIKSELVDDSTQTLPLTKRMLHMSRITVSLQLQTVAHKQGKSLQTELEKQRVLRNKLQQKLSIQQQAMNNFLQDIEIYQNKNKQLQHKIQILQAEKSLSAVKKQ